MKVLRDFYIQLPKASRGKEGRSITKKEFGLLRGSMNGSRQMEMQLRLHQLLTRLLCRHNQRLVRMENMRDITFVTTTAELTRR